MNSDPWISDWSMYVILSLVVIAAVATGMQVYWEESSDTTSTIPMSEVSQPLLLTVRSNGDAYLRVGSKDVLIAEYVVAPGRDVQEMLRLKALSKKEEIQFR